MGFRRHDDLRDILSNVDPPCSSQLSRRRSSRDGESSIRNRQRELGVDQQLLSEVLADLCACAVHYYR